MAHRFACWLSAFGMLVLLAACEDKAQPDYDRCVQMARPCTCKPDDPLCSCPPGEDLKAAWDACNAAVAADPNSKSGKLAAAKLGEVKVALDKERSAAEAKAKADEAAKLAAAEAMKARWPTMPTILARKIRDRAAADLMHASATPVMDVITAEIGQPAGSYDAGVSHFYVWGAQLGTSPTGEQMKGAPFAVRTMPRLMCGDYQGNMVEFYVSGNRIWPG
jgi:hypothetical protein